MELPFLPLLPIEDIKKNLQEIQKIPSRASASVPPNKYKKAVETFIEGAPKLAEAISTPASTFLTPLLKKAGLPSAIATGAGFIGDIVFVPGEGAEKILEKVTSKYGKDLAKQIFKAGGRALAEKSLIKEGEETVANALNIDKVKVTIGKLMSSIQEAKPLRKESEVLASAERTRRAAIGTKKLEIPGERGFFAAKGALRGELPKPQFTPIRERISQEELNSLFEHIKQSPNMPFYEKINTMTGLERVLGREGGGIPTEGELKLLKNTFGEDFVREILKKRPLGEKIKESIVGAANLPRALMASMDMSAPLRQGLVLSIHKPKQAIAAFGKMVKYFARPEYFDASMREIEQRPTRKLMRDSGLSITDVGEAASLSSKEEAFMTNLTRIIPLVRASERAYVGFLNTLRADVFDDMTKEYIKGGISPNKRPEVFTGLADFINTTSGRGTFGEKFTQLAPVLNTVFFSPRLIASRVQMLNPKWYLNLPPEVRKEAAKSFVKFVSSGIGLLTLAKLGGAQVEDDPRSSDFGKIRLGNTRFDIWGGFQQYIRIAAQLITGQTKSTSTQEIRELSKTKFPFTTRKEQLQRFIEGKFAPVPSLVNDLLRAQQLYGEPLDIPHEAFNKIVPLVIQDIVDAVKDSGLTMGVVAGIPSFFGTGVQTYKEKTRLSPVLPQLPQLPFLPTPSF